MKKIIFPRPFMVAIDDLGWMNGSSIAESGGPWRIGFLRKMKKKDYEPFVKIGEKLGIRFQMLFVLAEMDRLNILKKYPTTTWMGENWDNSENISSEQIEIMNYVKNNAANIEFGLHGVGHEHWENGKRTRAEWYDMENDKPWDESDLHTHVKAYKEILAQYGLDEENGHSFPESFVPCGWAYYWNPEGEYSTASVLKQYGVKFANTWFEKIPELNPPIKDGGGLDHGVLVLNRYNYGNDWYMVSSIPNRPLSEFKSDVIESHWSNWLATDDFLQDKTNEKWINFLKSVQKNDKRYLTKNTEQFYSQWVYKKYTKVKLLKGKIIIDNSSMPDEYYKYGFVNSFVLKVKLNKGEHVSDVNLDGKTIPAYYEDEGYGFFFLPPLQKRKYEFNFQIGEKLPENIIWHDGTFNVYNSAKTKNSLKFEVKIYGRQTVNILTEKPKRILKKGKIKIEKKKYDTNKGMLSLLVSAENIQGEKGEIVISL